MPFRLSKKSLEKLESVEEPLQKVVFRAIELTEVDFGVDEGERSDEQQAKNYANGSSRVKHSLHQDRKAVDLCAYVNGKRNYDWIFYEWIADAMFDAADELGVEIEWGGAWGFYGWLYGIDTAHDLHEDYVRDSIKAGRTPFCDGMHFQLKK